MSDAERLAAMREMAASWGPDFLDELRSVSIPDILRGRSAARNLLSARCGLRFSQDELARKAGVSAKRISLMEGGADAKLSTWKKVYAAMGFHLVLAPLTNKSPEELKAFCEQGRPRGHWYKSRSRPRRRPV